MFFASEKYNYPEDIFDDSRMSFGDHIEELRSRLIKALRVLVFFLVIGFVVDYIGEQIGQPKLGVGRPVLAIIKEPVETQVRDFYAKRNERAQAKLATMTAADRLTPDETAILEARVSKEGLTSLTPEERVRLRGTPVTMPVFLPVASLEKIFGPAKDPTLKEVEVPMQVYPAHISYLANKGETQLETRQYLTTLSVQEGMMVYFKVSLLCGFILASPWIFYQLWAFVAAGLYPHERRYVFRCLWPSVGLFLAGVFLCQFLVLPGAVKALLGFNLYIDMDPELRLNDWLGFAIILPLVFGLSFQTPLVMFVLNRLGMFTWESYLNRWRHAVMLLAVFAAVITPTPDVVTMLYLFVPMFALYMLGVGICYYFPMATDDATTDTDAEIAV
jgi:sec-independent protein translocase protein TatC